MKTYIVPLQPKGCRVYCEGRQGCAVDWGLSPHPLAKGSAGLHGMF